MDISRCTTSTYYILQDLLPPLQDLIPSLVCDTKIYYCIFKLICHCTIQDLYCILKIIYCILPRSTSAYSRCTMSTCYILPTSSRSPTIPFKISTCSTRTSTSLQDLHHSSPALQDHLHSPPALQDLLHSSPLQDLLHSSPDLQDILHSITCTTRSSSSSNP